MIMAEKEVGLYKIIKNNNLFYRLIVNENERVGHSVLYKNLHSIYFIV